MSRDYSEVELEMTKRLATFRAAALLQQWTACADAAEEMRHLSTELLLFAQKQRGGERD